MTLFTSENDFKKSDPLRPIIRAGVAALTLLLLGACATAPTKVTTLRPPEHPVLLSAPRNIPQPVSTPAEIQPPNALPPDTAATTLPPAFPAEGTRHTEAATEPAPATADTPPAYQESIATYYAKRFTGRRTASGERYDPARLTAATRDFPLQSWLKVINPANGREVTVRINDRTGKRKTPLIDLSRAAAKELGFYGKGKIRVHVTPVPPPR